MILPINCVLILSTTGSERASATSTQWSHSLVEALMADEGFSSRGNEIFIHRTNGSMVRVRVYSEYRDYVPESPEARFRQFLQDSPGYRPGSTFPSLPSGIGLGRARDRLRPSASLHANLPGPGSLQIRVYTDDADVEMRWDGKGGQRNGAFVREPAPPGWDAKFEGITRWVVALACGDKYGTGTERFAGRDVAVVKDPRGKSYFGLRSEARRYGWDVVEDRDRAVFTLRKGTRSWTLPLGSDRARRQDGSALQLDSLIVARGAGEPYAPFGLLSALDD